MKLMSTQTAFGCLEPLCRYLSILDLFIFRGSLQCSVFTVYFFFLLHYCSFKFVFHPSARLTCSGGRRPTHSKLAEPRQCLQVMRPPPLSLFWTLDQTRRRRPSRVSAPDTCAACRLHGRRAAPDQDGRRAGTRRLARRPQHRLQVR